jgi:hypothetical protein
MMRRILLAREAGNFATAGLTSPHEDWLPKPQVSPSSIDRWNDAMTQFKEAHIRRLNQLLHQGRMPSLDFSLFAVARIFYIPLPCD